MKQYSYSSNQNHKYILLNEYSIFRPVAFAASNHSSFTGSHPMKRPVSAFLSEHYLYNFPPWFAPTFIFVVLFFYSSCSSRSTWMKQKIRRGMVSWQNLICWSTAAHAQLFIHSCKTILQKFYFYKQNIFRNYSLLFWSSELLDRN